MQETTRIEVPVEQKKSYAYADIWRGQNLDSSHSSSQSGCIVFFYCLIPPDLTRS